MLTASQGLHQGEGTVLKEASTRPISRTVVSAKVELTRPGLLVGKNHTDRWKATGVIALAQANFKREYLTLVKTSLKKYLPDSAPLVSMQKLFLQGSGLSDESIQWEGIASLKRLMLLSISHNNLTLLPSAVGSLTSLRQLDVANNKLTSLPNELGLLTQLEILKANNNRLSSLPESIKNCSFLMKVDLSANILSELPETYTKLRNLKTLELNNTGLKTLPSILFNMCLQLSTLELHNTEITVEFLRQFEAGKILMKDNVPSIRSSLIFGLWGLANSMKALINLDDSSRAESQSSQLLHVWSLSVKIPLP